MNGRCAWVLALLWGVVQAPAVANPVEAAPDTGPGAAALHGWAGGAEPAAFEAWTTARLAAADAALARVREVRGVRTVANTLRPYDDAQNELFSAAAQTNLMFTTGTTAALRDKAQALSQTAQAAVTRVSLDRPVYDALRQLGAAGGTADAATRHYLERTLLQYRLAGVDRDTATRGRIQALQDQITELSLKFSRNVQDGMLRITATAAELDGLPPDYIARHPPDAQGAYTLTTDEPDAMPVLRFARSAALRERMYGAYNSRAYPANEPVLRALLQARQDLARLLGYHDFAELAVKDSMIGSVREERALVERVDAASRAAAAQEQARLLEFARSRDPAVRAMDEPSRRYWTQQYRAARLTFQSDAVRPYFPYAQVEAGVIKTAARLFHVDFQAVPNEAAWNPAVTVYDVRDGARRIGRVYLDMHPREGKDKWFSSAPVTAGVAGQQMPEGALICNFGGGEPGDPGLLDYADVVTFFHEFGHLMHHVLGGQGEWAGAGGFNVESDFVEAPSQMLEEFFHNPAVLQTFARHYQTGEVLPTAVIQTMNAADAFGRATGMQWQLVYAEFALGLHTAPAATVNFDALDRELVRRHFNVGLPPSSHDFASFTHLTGYGPNYYTYVLDKVIALDLFSQFDPSNLLDGPAALQYRHAVLEPGAGQSAESLVRNFLGRPRSTAAFERWVSAGLAAPPAP